MSSIKGIDLSEIEALLYIAGPHFCQGTPTRQDTRRERYLHAAFLRYNGATFKEVGQKLNISGERARQMCCKVSFYFAPKNWSHVGHAERRLQRTIRMYEYIHKNRKGPVSL